VVLKAAMYSTHADLYGTDANRYGQCCGLALLSVLRIWIWGSGICNTFQYHIQLMDQFIES
jgi:hypothetical protein